ncbi:MAG TPA: hypothetical protein VMD78_02425 [Candidatus Baltobacteraceae bacterium]|nr:hypothetical protein [Candidatus Baltobacteraceae bacterium]
MREGMNKFDVDEARTRPCDDASRILDGSEDEELFHLQADGFWGPEMGFQDLEEVRHQSQRRD